MKDDFFIKYNRVSWVTSNNDIHYLPLGSLVNLINQNYDVVCQNFYADSNIIISVSCIPEEFTSRNVLKYCKCPLYLPYEGISGCFLPSDFHSFTYRMGEFWTNYTPSSIGVNNMRTSCIFKYVLINVRGVVSSIHHHVIIIPEWIY